VLQFNHTIFEETKSYWTDEIIDIRMAAYARAGRIATSKATNPEYQMSELGDAFTYGESVAYVILIGDKHTGTANRSWVEYLFGTYPVFLCCHFCLLFPEQRESDG